MPLGRKQRCYVYVSFALFTLHTLLIAIICCLQLNTFRRHGCYPEDVLVIDAACKRSMYFIVMPNKYYNELVLIIICIVMLLLFVNCPVVICSPNMLVIFYGETPLVNCGPRSILYTDNTTNCKHCSFSFSAIYYCFPHHTFNPLYSTSQ